MIGAPVAVDVGDRQAVAVIVVSGLVGLSGVVDDAMAEGDAACRQPSVNWKSWKAATPAIALTCASRSFCSQDVSCRSSGT